ncbi:hypothetical protein M378DRAFT_158951 [Amanita muscaria Koide BX008]|uniref:Uncharacterized protein n=1 Tax=Amanita muscaria (strain Koide BX008) TaxID=946122 RepID=A0A0C2X0Y0_AMAMK|nr:hypothetical protein M378DRAFT_158951 [Amanita muscaria Koide BX008]
MLDRRIYIALKTLVPDITYLKQEIIDHATAPYRRSEDNGTPSEVRADNSTVA